MPARAKRAHYLGGQVGVQPADAESLVDLGGQLGQAARRPERLRRAEQLAQQFVVHVGAPGQAVEAHLGPDQRAGRLGGHQQAEAARVLRGEDAALLVRVHLAICCEGVETGRGGRTWGGIEERALGETRGLGRARWRVGRDRQAVQAGPGCRERARLAPAPGVAEQQRLGQLQIVAAGDAHTRAQQRGVDLVGGGPDPAGRIGRLAGRDGRRQVGSLDRRADGSAVGPQILKPAVRRHHHEHRLILPAGYDTFPLPARCRS